MKYIIICLIILLAVVPAETRTVELTLHPAKSLKPEQKYQLIGKAEDQIDADAAPLYEKALQSLPGGLKMDEINQWLKIPPDKLPKKQVQSALEQLKPAFKLIEQAAKCKQCDWPYLDDDTLSQTLANYRKLLFLFALQVRFQIAQGSYNEAIGSMQIGFGMARHLGGDPILVRGLVGIGMAAYMCRQIEQFVQRPDAPNLYQALRDLPQPLIDLTMQAEWEEPDIKGKVYLLMNRLDRHVAALQCIEAIRHYAATHDGRLPENLSNIGQVEVPKDVTSGKAFEYRRTAIGASLQSAIPEGGKERDAVNYEIVLKK
ncbi:hypothetical protein ACFL5F_02430 [Planctomycetota bacterium]